MISHTYKCIFIHIPKTAGTSIISSLSDDQRNRIDLIEPFLPCDEKFSPPPPHLRAIDYINYGHINKDDFDRYFKFSFVRNPWDRVVSEYKYRGHAAKYSFKTYLFKYFPKPSWSDEYCHIIPQYDFIYDKHEKLLVDYVAKFEHIEESFNYICNKLNIENKKLHHKNKSMSLFRRDNSLYFILRTIRNSLNIRQKSNTFKHYTEYYDNECIEFIEKLYADDIKVFNYSYGE